MTASNPQYLSIWDVAHHWHGVAVPVEPGPLPPAVRSMLTALLQGVLDSDLWLYEPVVVPTGMHGRAAPSSVCMLPIESLPPEIEDMFLSGAYDAKLLAIYRLDIDDILWWAATNGEQDIPDFCVSERSRAKGEPHSEQAKMRPEAEDKRLCQEIARRKWAESNQIRIAEMARCPEIQVEGNGGLYRPATVIGWLREVAPEGVRNRPGRPVGKVETKS